MSHASETRFLRAGLEQLKDYLLSNEIFWNLGFDPQLTLGNLLLAEAHVKAGSPSAEEKQLLADLQAQKKEWRTAWEAKATKEYASRLRQWTQYLNELSENPDRHGGQYKTEARVRALLEVLSDEAPGLGSELERFDQSLKPFVTDGDFIWGSDSQAAFPKDKYWFLYAKPRGK